MLLDCYVVPGGPEQWGLWPRSAACKKALSGPTYALWGLFPIYSYTWKYFLYFISPQNSPSGISLFARSQWWWVLPSYDDIEWQIPVLWWFSFAWEQEWDAEIAPVLKLLSQASTFWFLSVPPRTVVSKSYHYKWKSTQISLILLWQMGKGNTRDEVIC